MMSTGGCSRTVTALLAATLVVVSLALPASARAVERLALVIGNAAYVEAPLRNPVNDARAMAATLESVGFEVIRLENATKDQIERAVVQFASRLDDDSSGLFYYAGHGIQVRGRNYLVPVGTRFQSQQEARIESVGVDLVLDELAYAGNRLNIVILDACRNNPFERRLRGASRGLAAVDAARGTLIAYATAPGSVALDGDGRNGLYTEELLRALANPGMQIEEVFKQVRIGVARRTNDQQIPWESSSLTGSFVFKPVSTNVSPAVLTKPQHETVFWESVERIGTVGAYQAYLNQYPGGVFATLATIRISELKASEEKPVSIGEQVGLLVEKSQASSPSSKRAGDEQQTIAVLPLMGKDFCQTHAGFDEGGIARTLQRSLEKAGLSSTIFRYLGWGNETEPKALWRSVGLRKEPNPELVYEHGKNLKVDGMLLLWYEIAGVHTCRTDYDIHFFDVRLENHYRDRATEAALGSVTDDLVARFVKERALAQISR